MFNKRHISSDHPTGKETFEPDEGWWASVLADEVSQFSDRKDSSTKSAAPVLINVDWEFVQGLFERDEVATLQVYGFNRGGLLVEGTGIQGFVPISHLVDVPPQLSDEERHQKMSSYVGKKLQLKIIECEASQDRIVLSERAALAGEGRRKHLFQSLKKGEVVNGTVTNITDFGVFVDLGGLEGLIHVSELSWGRVQHPSAILAVGDIVRAQVLEVNAENGRVALSLKRLITNPWEELAQMCKVGDIVTAVITSIVRYGAFARMEQGIEGLIHITSIPLSNDEKNLENLLQPGQVVKVQILNIDVHRRRLGLSLPKIHE